MARTAHRRRDKVRRSHFIGENSRGMSMVVLTNWDKRGDSANAAFSGTSTGVSVDPKRSFGNEGWFEAGAVMHNGHLSQQAM